MSIPERIYLVETIWDSIADNAEALKVTDAQALELDKRLQALKASPDEGDSWKNVKSRILNGN